MASVIRPPADELDALLLALALPDIGPPELRRKVRESGGVVPASDALARRVLPELTRARREKIRGWVRAARRTIDGSDIHVLTLDTPGYPESLRPLAVPPYVLFARGRLDLADERCVAVVGTRAATPQGRETAHRIATQLAAADVVVVSGLARGIDGVAHRAVGPARTIAVVGCGLDVSYPPEHADLQEAIGREGLLISEFLPGMPPKGHNFPRRNRLIAGLAASVVVVEAPLRSGALSTAKAAADLSRPVFAVPGSVHDAKHRGSNELYRDGAHVATGASDVLRELKWPSPPPGILEQTAPVDLAGMGLALWRALEPEEPRHVDAVAGAVGLEPGECLASLLALEIQGHARQLPGMRFLRERD